MKISQASVMDTVRDYLNSQGWRFNETENRFKFGMNLKSRLGSTDVLILCHEGHFTVYAYSPLKASEDIHEACMSFITYANYGLRRGNFEMDLNDGEIRFKNFLGFGDTFPSASEVDATIDIAILMMDRYGNGLTKVMFGGSDPKAACEECEAQ